MAICSASCMHCVFLPVAWADMSLPPPLPSSRGHNSWTHSLAFRPRLATSWREKEGLGLISLNRDNSLQNYKYLLICLYVVLEINLDDVGVCVLRLGNNGHSLKIQLKSYQQCQLHRPCWEQFNYVLSTPSLHWTERASRNGEEARGCNSTRCKHYSGGDFFWRFENRQAVPWILLWR